MSNLFQLKKPRFILGRTTIADVAVRNGKADPAKSYKGALLSAGSDMGKGRNGAGVTYDRFSHSTLGEDDAWNSGSKKGGQIVACAIFDGARQNPGRGAISDGQKQKIVLQGSPPDVAILKSPSHVGPGLGILNQSEADLRNSGQASFNLDKYQLLEGSAKAHAKLDRWASRIQSKQAHNQLMRKPLLENRKHGSETVFNSKLNGPGPTNQFRWVIKQKTHSKGVSLGSDSCLKDLYYFKRDCKASSL